MDLSSQSDREERAAKKPLAKRTNSDLGALATSNRNNSATVGRRREEEEGHESEEAQQASGADSPVLCASDNDMMMVRLISQPTIAKTQPPQVLQPTAPQPAAPSHVAQQHQSKQNATSERYSNNFFPFLLSILQQFLLSASVSHEDVSNPFTHFN